MKWTLVRIYYDRGALAPKVFWVDVSKQEDFRSGLRLGYVYDYVAMLWPNEYLAVGASYYRHVNGVVEAEEIIRKELLLFEVEFKNS